MKVTLGEAGRHLGSAVAADHLATCGLLGEITLRGNRRYVEPAIAQDLRDRPEIDSAAPPAFVVRMARPHPSAQPWREHQGWHQVWPEQIKRDAIRGDWVIDPAAVVEVGRLVALVAGYVVAAYAVDDVEAYYLDTSTGRRRARFTLREDPQAATSYLGHHWTLRRGWTAAICDPAPSVHHPVDGARSTGPARPASSAAQHR